MSYESIVDFISNTANKKISDINTSLVGTITAINDNKTLDIDIDTNKDIKLYEVPFVTVSGGCSYLQFPISVGDKALVIFSKDDISFWFGGDNEITKSNFSFNNGFALVGVNVEADIIPLQTYTELKVDKIKIHNETAELITLLSELCEALENATVPTVTGLQPLSTKVDIISIKEKINSFKV